MLSQKEFAVLYALYKTEGMTQRELAEETKMSLGSVNTAVRLLQEYELIDSGHLTTRGKNALKPYKVSNAIILAAGLSSRFAPISYEKPKGLLEVRGEILIERQIEQLHEAGIDDITVVVGYKKEYFFYLQEKYGVSIVVNNEYATRNNHSSLMAAIDKLDNTYICSSDDYFTVNPFESHVYRAYYASEFIEGKTKEWCLSTTPSDKITDVEIGGCDSWIMLGHVYFDRAFSSKFAQILRDEYDLAQTKDKLWEELYIDHINELDMYIKRYDKGIINEFDSLDEVRDFDPTFIKNVNSQVFSNICSVLKCDVEEIHDIYPLKQGLTNLSFHFRTNSGVYVYRHPGIGTEKMIDRYAEYEAQKLGSDLGIDTTFIYEDPKTGWKLTRFIENAKPLDTKDFDQVHTAMQMCKKLHEADIQLSSEFNYYKEAQKYEDILLQRGEIEIPHYYENRSLIEELESFVIADNVPLCVCHNDILDLNFLIDENNHFDLIDWEYAGMSDYANDFGTYCIGSQYTEEEIDKTLELYFERKPTVEETRHNYAHIALAGWCWYVWSLVKEAEGAVIGEWLYIYYNYGMTYAKKALDLYRIN